MGTSTRGERAILGFHVLMALMVKSWASAAEKTSVGIAMAQCSPRIWVTGDAKIRLLHDLRNAEEAARGRRSPA